MQHAHPSPSNSSSPAELLDRLIRSDAYDRYSRAFRKATGLSLWLAGVNNSRSCESGNPFCRTVNSHQHNCDACEMAHSGLRVADGAESHTVKCFANLRETAIPVWFGKSLIAHLRTGQVFSEVPSEENFERTLEILREEPQFRESDVEELKKSYFAGKVINDEHYNAIVEMLVIFAMQLSCELERQPATTGNEMPEAIQRVCQHLRSTFDEPFSLAHVSKIAGISAHHLCSVFKATTGTTLTEFHNRERILQAKKRLTSRYARISEVALDVGFGSLSQFNRSFLKYAGESPTDFRKRVIAPIHHHRPLERSAIRRRAVLTA